jgi:hypothetical protein
MEELQKAAAEQPIEPVAAQAVWRFMNDMLAMWDAMGISLGYTEVNNMADLVTVPDGARMGIKAILAISLAGKFKAEVTPSVLQRAKDGWQAILNLTVHRSQRSYPAILPVGSGNSFPGYQRTQFYPNVEDAILTEQNANIGLEIDTEV